MIIKGICIRREGAQDDPEAELVVELWREDDSYVEIAREKLSSNFSRCIHTNLATIREGVKP